MGNPTIAVTGCTTTGPTSTISLTATLQVAINNLASNNVEAWVTYYGSQISATVNLGPTLGQPTKWSGTITNVGGSGITVWVVVYITPPDNTVGPFSNSVSYAIPAGGLEKKKKPRAKPKAEQA